jgi:hypothetical protein
MRITGWLAATLPLFLSLAPGVAAAQGRSTQIPAVVFRFDPTYQAVVAGGEEERRDPADDVRWAERRAESLTDFHAENGGRLLRLLSEYAGLDWPYREIEVYVVRRFPTLSIQYPLTLAVGTIEQGQGRQEIPGDDFLTLTFAHQITHYLLDPAPEPLGAYRPEALDHPLMEEGNFRRESLINLVTYRALEDIWGAQRLRRARQEPLWESYNPEAAFVDSLENRWNLSRSRPLVSWLLQEGREGRLVKLAEQLESSRSGGGRDGAGAGGDARAGDRQGPVSMAGSEVGFDLGQSAEGRLFIAFLDPTSPAEAAGLRPGDVVLTVEGRRFASVSEAMRTVRDAWRANGEVNLSVERQGQEVFFQVR